MGKGGGAARMHVDLAMSAFKAWAGHGPAGKSDARAFGGGIGVMVDFCGSGAHLKPVILMHPQASHTKKTHCYPHLAPGLISTAPPPLTL